MFVADKMSRRGRKRKVEEEEPKINDEDQDNFFPDETRVEVETMWEVIEIIRNRSAVEF